MWKAEATFDGEKKVDSELFLVLLYYFVLPK